MWLLPFAFFQYQVLLNNEFYDAPEYKNEVSHSLPPGTECTLFGCYQEGLFLSYNYAMRPALCIIGKHSGYNNSTESELCMHREDLF